MYEKRPEKPTVTDAGVLDVAYRHLESLHEAGTVKRRKTGKTVFWWRSGGDVTRPAPTEMEETNPVEATESFEQDP